MASDKIESTDFQGGIEGAAPFRVLPRYAEEEAAFWKCGEHDRLEIQFCNACKHWNHPATPICPLCHSRDVSSKPVSGRGTIYSYTINVQAWNPTFEHPYAIAVIELEEQSDLRLVSNVYGCKPEDLYIGMPVEVFFEAWEEIWLPLFRVTENTVND
jgi:uncharacterized OB-fold protein